MGDWALREASCSIVLIKATARRTVVIYDPALVRHAGCPGGVPHVRPEAKLPPSHHDSMLAGRSACNYLGSPGEMKRKSHASFFIANSSLTSSRIAP